MRITRRRMTSIGENVNVPHRFAWIESSDQLARKRWFIAACLSEECIQHAVECGGGPLRALHKRVVALVPALLAALYAIEGVVLSLKIRVARNVTLWKSLHQVGVLRDSFARLLDGESYVFWSHGVAVRVDYAA